MEKEEPVIKELMNSMPQVGKIEHIVVRPNKLELPILVPQSFADANKSLSGDHFSSKTSKKRQVTLIQAEHLQGVASMLGIRSIDPRLTRRNIVVSGINLLALRNQKFKIGEAVFEGTGYCHPCSRMEQNFGPGGYNAMRGHGGITATILQSGEIKVGDEIKLIS